MKKTLALLLLLINSYTFSQSYPHISELRGIEDSLGNTQLFYRYVFPGIPCWIRSIYHLDINSISDTLFIYDAAVDPIGEGCRGQYVYDYEFVNDMVSEFVYGGLDFFYDAVPIFIRYDGSVLLPPLFPMGGAVTEVEISSFDSSIIYLNVLQFGVASYLLKSTDSGYNFFELNVEPYIDYYIISLSKNNYSQIYGIDNNKLVRSENDGSSYLIVDNSQWSDNSKLFYDVDQTHIYGFSVFYNYSTQSYSSKIYVSNDNGNPFTWSSLIEQDGKVWFTIDENNSGENYYAFGKRIFKSTDFGSTYNLYKELDQKITGLYKKSSSEILYTSTPLKIYEITPDSIQIIKNLPIPESEYAWYPLNPDDKWIYNHTFYGDVGDSIRWISINEVTGYKVLNDKVYNEVTVKEIPIDPGGNSGSYFEYFRIDSTNGKILKAGIENDSLLYEELYMDLLIQVGDTIPVGNGIYLESEVPFSIFGLTSRKRTFYHTLTPVKDIQLVNGIGLIYEYTWELVGSKQILNGCIVDGVVYGDTTTVGVEDEETPITTNFKLEQNYPNPFNPTTKIKFSIPSVIARATKQSQFVTLKVYDVLGNEIVTLLKEEISPGEYEVEFDSHSGEVRNLTSGIYFYQLKTGEFVQTKKMILMK